ncbi:MAG: hypothetical protein ACOVSW_19525 [Candidatus Kapaibacteriota bacterium]|jgi:hypothetical protein
MQTSTNHYANLSFRVAPQIKEQFVLLTALYGKAGVEVFSDLVREAMKQPLSNKQLRSLSPELRHKILLLQRATAEPICTKFADDLALDDLAENWKR